MAGQSVDMDRWLRMHSEPEARRELDIGIRQSWERSIAYDVDYIHARPVPISPSSEQIKLSTKRLYIYK